MKLTIQNAINKSEWVEKLGIFLHDSELLTEGEWFQETKQFTLFLKRPKYEVMRCTRLFYFIPVWRYGAVSTKIIIEPVDKYEESPVKRKLLHGEPVLFLHMALINEKILEIATDFGHKYLTLNSESTIYIEDICIEDKESELSKETMFDFFRPAIDLKLIRELMEVSTV